MAPLKLLMILAVVVFAIPLPGVAGSGDTLDYYQQIRNQDMSGLLVETAVNGYNDGGPLGFIGNDFQRFLIHFDHIHKPPGQPDTYYVSGKTMVKENRCVFKGYIRIKAAITFPCLEMPALRYGALTAVLHIEEEKRHDGSGVIKGLLHVDFLVDSAGGVHFNDIEMGADGYRGRQFQGKWTSNATGKSKVCNWGDYRITAIKGSEDHIDVGDGEFMVNPLYRKNGWENYCLAWSDALEGKEALQKQAHARELENTWWK